MHTTHYPVEISAGKHARTMCPVTIHAADQDMEGANALVSENGSVIALQRMMDGTASIILDEAAEFETLRYQFATKSPNRPEQGMQIRSNGDAALDVFKNNELVSTYHFGGELVRPYFFPVNEPGGICVTRSYPMLVVPHETSDHPHHKSLWIAHGDVQGTDNWSEEDGHGFTRHVSVDHVESGPVAACFSTTSEWLTPDRRPLLTQKLVTTFWNGSFTHTLVDFHISLTNDRTGDSMCFGDTKEGGILSVRVASELDATRGGFISNVYGGRNEGECWGKPSHWCSYSGSINGVPCGIAVLNHPDSFRAPTTWHVRDYGLMTANPFGYSAFTHGKRDGSYMLPEGATIEFQYRLVVHRDPRIDLRCSQMYLDYAFPPRVRLIHGHT